MKNPITLNNSGIYTSEIISSIVPRLVLNRKHIKFRVIDPI